MWDKRTTTNLKDLAKRTSESQKINRNAQNGVTRTIRNKNNLPNSQKEAKLQVARRLRDNLYEAGNRSSIEDDIDKWRRVYSWIGPEPVLGLDTNGNVSILKLQCLLCESLLTPQTSVLKKHEKSLKHCAFTGDLDFAENFDREIATAEIEVAATIMFRACSFNVVDYWVAQMKKIFHDSRIAAGINIHRKKTPKIGRNVILPCHINRVANEVRGNKFVIEVDGYTDQHNTEAVCICLKYFNKEQGRMVEVLFDIVEVFNGDEDAAADSDNLTEIIVAPFIKNNIPLLDCMGLKTDGASVMIGVHKSVLRGVQVHNERIPGFRCYCHVLHLVARDGMQMYKDFEQIPHMLYNYFSRSPKKDHRRLVFQLKLETEALKMRNPTVVRWLSFFECQIRITRLWSFLDKFFEKECSNESTSNEDAIALKKYFSGPLSKAQHYFILQVYSKIYVVEKKLQAEKPLITAGRRMIRDLYVTLLRMYMHEPYIMTRPLELVEPANIHQMKKVDQLSLDPTVIHLLRGATPTERSEFLKKNRDFLSNLCVKFRGRYDFSQDYLLHMQFLEPSKALDPNFHTGEYKTLQCVYEKLPVLTNNDQELIDKINEEWKNLPTESLSEDLKGERDPETFWHRLSLVKDEDGRNIFSALSEFALNCLTIPNSNAKPERVASAAGWQITPRRGQLSFQAKRGILLTQEYVKSVGGLKNFKVTDEMLLNYVRHLNDPVKDTKYFKDISTYMGEYITDQLKESCRNDNQFGKNLMKKLNHMIASDDLSLEFDLGDFVGMEPSAIVSVDNVHDGMSNMSLDNVTVDVAPTDDIQFDSTPVSYQSNTPLVCERGSSIIRYPHVYPNGLFFDHKYYFTEVPRLPIQQPQLYKNYQVCRIRRDVNDGQEKDIRVDWTDFYTMRPKEWVSGRIIDACAAVKERNWQNATFISTDLTASFFGKWVQEPEDDWALFRIQFPVTGKIFFPFLKDGNHWVLFTIDMDAGHVFFLDPMKRTNERELLSDERFCMGKLVRFINLCITRGITNAISNKRTYTCVRPNFERVYQTDSWSCADFDINIMDTLGRNVNFDKRFKPDPYRVLNAKTLIRESETMTDGCIFCGGTDRTGTYECSCCNRFYHWACAEGIGIRLGPHCPVCSSSQTRRASI